ncbi:hypothetical protein HB991_07860 [Yersinia mollaretii]|uniref:Uncharacterized protein n=1 Tax=Yersinia mollaretii TaxID=33060 RepID=A0AA44CKM9_YERMO|nr:hypothetical protein [Yersinia mollaretii]NIL22427.1 hypothetical protein [Yersinia mollaretii]CNI74613.1 Uncharacterised protein [Yersinia mollaretii]CQQ72203.1 Uncharacterised protein [Yersinia mollaretii]
MKRKIILSIAVGSLMGIGATQLAHAEPNAPEAVSIKPQSGGKCASGKCGTEKIYSQAKITHDPQNLLVRARDGKCGLDGYGIQQQAPEKEVLDKFTSGVCGQ